MMALQKGHHATAVCPPSTVNQLMKTAICRSKVVTALITASLSWACQAGQGLAAPQADTWWPQWQARLSLQTLPLAGQSLTGHGNAALGMTTRRGVQSGALLGDYYFARQLAGHFRASGGLMVGSPGGAPVSFVSAPASAAPARLGLSLSNASAPAPGIQASDSAEAVPYLGFGYSGSLWRDSVSLTADLGLVSERPSAAGSVGRAVFGNQGMNQALRDMRLSPVLQLGMRYTF